MSAAGVAKTGEGAFLRRAACRMVAWLSLPGRPRHVRAARMLPPWRRLALGVLIAVICVGAAMILLDARALAFVRTFSIRTVDVFNEITDFGRSSWVLIPLAVLIVLATLTPTAGRTANLVMASLVVRFEFLFLAVAVPSLFVGIVKRWIGRVRPSARGPFACRSRPSPRSSGSSCPGRAGISG